jgi:aminocarboxymuconate-semialdehyde decarboxylase
MMKIDVHSHFYTKEYVEMIRKFDPDRGSNITGINFSVWRSPEERIDRMDKCGIDMEVLSLSAPNVYFADRSLSLDLAQMTNDFLAGLSRKYPDRFVGVASLPMLDMGDSLAELHRAVERLGLRGVVLGSNINGKRPDAPEFEGFFSEIERMRQPILIHPMPPSGRPSSDEYKLTAILSLPFDTTVCVTRMIYSGIFERHPGLRSVLPHLGGALPFLSTRIDLGFKSYRECWEKVSKPPSDYLRGFYYDTAVSFGRPALICTAELVGIDHILFGTDYPFQRDAADTVAALESLCAEPHLRKRIFSENAKALFGLEV